MIYDSVSTWTKDPELDAIYESLRKKHLLKNYRLKNNYKIQHVYEVSAKSIYWDKNGQPKIVCSILSRSCWPKGVYRILNRLWKTENEDTNIFTINYGFGMLIENQIQWCKDVGYNGVFMSREGSGNWQKWSCNILNKMLNLNFEAPNKKYLTCDNEQNKSCWQRILYLGDSQSLKEWRCIDD